MRAPNISVFIFCGLLVLSRGAQAAHAMNDVAEKYAHLVLALGQHDPDYVDAFYGPAEWKALAEREKLPLDTIGTQSAELLRQLRVESTAAPLVESKKAEKSKSDGMDCCAPGPEDGEMVKLRREYLQK